MKTKRNTIGDARHYKDEIKDLVGKKLPICVDFDGCLCAHHYPMIGKENKPCVEVLKNQDKKNGLEATNVMEYSVLMIEILVFL